MNSSLVCDGRHWYVRDRSPRQAIASRSVCLSLGLGAELRNEASNQGQKAGV
jgi:hypothetical protein